MKYNIIQPEERFSVLQFKPEIQPHIEMTSSLFTCGKCKTTTPITTRDLQEQFGVNKSSLSDEVKKFFDQVRPLDEVKWEYFMDFSCKHCDMQIRIIYQPWQFGTTNYGFYITLVLEIDASEL